MGNIYVSKGGNDSNNGLTALTPKLTLAGAKAICASGDNVIYLGIGDYIETIDWNVAGKDITIIGDYDGAIFGETVLDSYTKLMLHFDGPDSYTSIIDSVLIERIITRTGGSLVRTSQSKFGGSSIYFDGTGDYISIPDSADFNYGTGDFTIDFWIRFTSRTAYDTIYSQHQDDTNRLMLMLDGSTNELQFYVMSGGSAIADYTTVATTPLANDTWYHIALVRNGTNVYIFKDGVAQTLTTGTAISTTAMPDLTSPITIGARKTSGAADRDSQANVDEFRVSNGIARWTSNFTAPTVAYSANIVRIWQASNPTANNKIKRMDRLTLRQSNSNGIMFVTTTAYVIQPTVTFNYVNFELYATLNMFTFSANDYGSVITLNNCRGISNDSVKVYDLISSNNHFQNELIMNNCDFYTNVIPYDNNYGMRIQYRIGLFKFNNSPIRLRSISVNVFSPYFTMQLENTDWKVEYTLSTVFTLSIGIHVQLSYYKNYLKNITAIDATEFKQLWGNTYAYPKVITGALGMTKIDHIYKYQEIYKIYGENFNADAKKYIINALNVLAFKDTDYNTKEVMTFRLPKAVTTNESVYVIPLDVNDSTSYTLSYSYKRNTTNNVDAIVKVFKGQDAISTTPLATATYAGADHTANTWYDKTLAFTTDATDDVYYLVITLPIVGTGTLNEISFTAPTLA